jgi:hypothetical protein
VTFFPDDGSTLVPTVGRVAATASFTTSGLSAGSHNGSVDIEQSTGLVIVGDPADECAGNTITGSLLLHNNAGGVVAIGNTRPGRNLDHRQLRTARGCDPGLLRSSDRARRWTNVRSFFGRQTYNRKSDR